MDAFALPIKPHVPRLTWQRPRSLAFVAHGRAKQRSPHASLSPTAGPSSIPRTPACRDSGTATPCGPPLLLTPCTATQALAQLESIYGERHWLYVSAMHNLALCHEAAGDLGAAVDTMGRVMKLRLSMFGARHFLYADSMFALGLMMLKQAQQGAQRGAQEARGWWGAGGGGGARAAAAVWAACPGTTSLPTS